MTDSTHINPDSILVAIDIAKQNHDALILWPSGHKKVIRIPNTLEGYQQLLKATHALPAEITIGFEPTADYHRNVAFWFKHQGAQCMLASSLSVARAREMLFKTWDKHDRKDARLILYLMQQGMVRPFYDPLVESTMDIQELSNTYHQISLSRTRIQHSLLNHYLTLYFPEMERYLHSTRAEWFCRLLLKFPTPNSILRYKKATFVKRAWDIVGRKVCKQRFLEEVYEIAAHSIGLPVALKGLGITTFKLQLQRYLELSIQRNELEKMAESMLSQRTDYQRLRTLPGVGPIISLIKLLC